MKQEIELTEENQYYPKKYIKNWDQYYAHQKDLLKKLKSEEWFRLFRGFYKVTKNIHAAMWASLIFRISMEYEYESIYIEFDDFDDIYAILGINKTQFSTACRFLARRKLFTNYCPYGEDYYIGKKYFPGTGMEYKLSNDLFVPLEQKSNIIAFPKKLK